MRQKPKQSFRYSKAVYLDKTEQLVPVLCNSLALAPRQVGHRCSNSTTGGFLESKVHSFWPQTLIREANFDRNGNEVVRDRSTCFLQTDFTAV